MAVPGMPGLAGMRKNMDMQNCMNGLVTTDAMKTEMALLAVRFALYVPVVALLQTLGNFYNSIFFNVYLLLLYFQANVACSICVLMSG